MGDTGSLRQVTKKGPCPTGDIEDLLEGAASSPTDDPAPAPGPASLAKAVFRRVVDTVTAPDEDDVSRPGGLLTLFRQVVLGLALGVGTVAALVYLDHRDVVHLESAHRFREAAFGLLSDPETLANVQEASGLRFLPRAEYEALRREVDETSVEEIGAGEEELRQRTAQAEEKRKEAEVRRAEHESLLHHPLLGLDRYCGGCAWGGGSTCDARVTYLRDTYSTRTVTAKINAMGHPSCIKKQ